MATTNAIDTYMLVLHFVTWCMIMAPQGTLNGFVINKNKRVSASKDEAGPAAKKKKVSLPLVTNTFS